MPRRPRSGDTWTNVAIVLGVALLVIGIALILIFGPWGKG